MKTESSNYTVRSGLLVELSPSCRLKEIKRMENRETQSSPLCVSLSYGYSPGKKTITGHLYSILGDITRLQIKGMTLVSKISFLSSAFFSAHIPDSFISSNGAVGGFDVYSVFSPPTAGRTGVISQIGQGKKNTLSYFCTYIWLYSHNQHM